MMFAKNGTSLWSSALRIRQGPPRHYQTAKISTYKVDWTPGLALLGERVYFVVMFVITDTREKFLPLPRQKYSTVVFKTQED